MNRKYCKDAWNNYKYSIIRNDTKIHKIVQVRLLNIFMLAEPKKIT